MVEFIIPSIMPNQPVTPGRRGAEKNTLRGKVLAARRGRRRQRRYSLSRYDGEERRRFKEKRRTQSLIDKNNVRIITLQVTADQDLDNLVGKEVVLRVLG